MSYLVDSHCHLDFLQLENASGGLASALDQARNKGVGHFLTVAVSQDNVNLVKTIAEQYDDVHCAVGIHPLELHDEHSLSLDWLLKAINHPKVVAIGETGLDFHYHTTPAQIQQRSFELHLQAAKQTNKPIIVHTRQAKELTLQLLKHADLCQAGVLHCFTEDWQMAKTALDLGYFISISGIVTFRNADSIREVAKKIPLDRLLVETDSPYLAPIPYRGKSNLPEYVKEVADYLANLRNIPLDTLTSITTENFYRLFSLAKVSK